MAKLIKAPFLDEQPNSPFEDLIILAGSKAWQSWGKGKAEEWQLLCEVLKSRAGQKPVILGANQLSELANLRIAPAEQKFIKVVKAGELSEIQLTAICKNLADNNQAQSVALLDNIGQLAEDLTQSIENIRQGNNITAKELEKLNVSKVKEGDRTNEKAKAFKQWLGLELARHKQSREIYQYNGKVWQAVDEMELSYKVVQFFEEQDIGYSDKGITSLINTLRMQLTPMKENQGDFIAFNNGVLNRETFELEPHSPERWLTSYIPYDYQAEQLDTPNFDKWIQFVANGSKDKEYRVLSALYAVLTNRYDWQLFFEITGSGGSGKSVFAHIATMLTGAEKTASINLSKLDEARDRSAIFDKRLIICPDQPKYTGDGSGLKAITGGDLVLVDPKHKRQFSTVIKSIIMLINNQPTRFTERAGGIERRRVIFRFDRVVPAHERDYSLLDKISTEIGGIIRKLLDTFPDKWQAKQALEAQMMSKESLESKMESDLLSAFCEYLVTTEEINGLYIGNNAMPESMFRTYLYVGYMAFINANGQQNGLTLNNFSNAIKQGLQQHGNQYAFEKCRTKKGFRTNVHYKNVDDFFKDFLSRG